VRARGASRHLCFLDPTALLLPKTVFFPVRTRSLCAQRQQAQSTISNEQEQPTRTLHATSITKTRTFLCDL
jgi:hypothetical protein